MSKYTGGFSGLVILIVLWQLGVVLTGVPKWLMPAPTDVWASWMADYRLLLFHSAYTLIAALTGFGLAVISGTLLALVMDLWPALRNRIYPLLVLSQTIPIITVAPLLIIWLGYGLLPKVLVVALVCFFPVTINVIGGMQAADNELVDLLTMMGASKWQVVKLARLPAAFPSFFSGLRISATYCVMAAVIGEWLGSSQGLGVILTRASHSFQMGRVFAVMSAIVVLSLIIFLMVEGLARVVMPWHYRGRNEKKGLGIRDSKSG